MSSSLASRLPWIQVVGLTTLALLPVVAGAAKPLEFFRDGASSAELSGPVEVPLLRGIDTELLPAVLAAGPPKDDRDEFLMTLDLTGGPTRCTEGVVGALGGWIQEKTVARQGGGFKKTVKTVQKAGYIPELHIGDLVLKDVHCAVDAKINRLSIPATDEIAVAVLPSRGVVKFVAAADADALLKEVGTPVDALSSEPQVYFNHGAKTATLGRTLVFPGEFGGQPAMLYIAPELMSGVRVGHPGIARSKARDGVLFTAGAFGVGSEKLPEAATTVMDAELGWVPDGSGQRVDIDGWMGPDVTWAADIAVDPAGARVAIARAAKVTWEDPSERILDEARKAYEKTPDASASLLRPLETGDALASLSTSTDPCLAELVVASGTRADALGLRTLSAASDRVVRVECEASIRTATDGEDAGGGDSGDDADSADAERRANYGDALWKHGKFKEAYKVYGAALGASGEDCSYPLDYAEKSLVLGETDAALTNAEKSGTLYQKWADQDLGVRLAIGRGESPENAYETAQANECHRAWGIEASALLARGSHDKVDAIYKRHMDLDEDLALAAALGRIQRGRPDQAQGLLLQALNVGGRGDARIHGALGIVAVRTGRMTLAEANLERLTSLYGHMTLADALTAAYLAREIGGAEAAQTLAEQLVSHRPYSVNALTVYGLEARRRGDQAGVSRVAERAAAATDDNLAANAGGGFAYCEAAALNAVAGNAKRAAELRAEAEGRPGTLATSTCATADAVIAAVSGDAQKTSAALQSLARTYPLEPLGTLSLLQSLPAAEPAPE